MSDFRSLFLPLAEAERAVFAAVFPLLLTVPSAVEGGAAAAAGEHGNRLSPQQQQQQQQQGRRTAHADPGILSPVSATSALFSPAEGALSASPRESVSEAQARRGVPLRSLVFAVGCARAEALLVVLRSAHVVVFGLDRPRAPPYELYRLRPLPTTQQLQVARDVAAGKPRHGGSSGGSAAEATCATLIPLHIAYCCRLSVPTDGRRRRAAPLRPALHHGGAGIEGDSEEEEVYLRGLVGGSDGRVSVFSDAAYTLSFAAHETPVAQVDAVLLPPCSLHTAASSAHTGGNVRGSTASSMATFTGGGVSRPASPTANAAAAVSSRGSPLLPSSSAQQQQQQRWEGVQNAMDRLGIVTSGTDGVVMLWRRLDGAMAPVVLLRPSHFSRQVPYTPYHPSPLSALLASIAPKSHREAAIDAALCCPPSCLVHATSRHAHGLRVRQLASLASAPSSSTQQQQQQQAEASSFSSSLGSTAAAVVDTAERAAPTWLRVPMPGSWTAAVTALAVHNGLTLVARESTLFSLVRFDGNTPVRVWRAEHTITHLVLQDTIALAVCAKAGAVHVLTINPVTGHGAHVRSFYAYGGRAIQHVSLHEPSLLMTVVDGYGSTELVQLPPDVMQLRGGHPSGSAEGANLLASMAALRAKVCIEEVKGAGKYRDGSCGVPSMYEANAALDELNERLLLARCAVPEECDRYLATHQHVF